VSSNLVVNCASVPGTEMASILSAREGGEVLFFSMATSFTAAALGAEGAGKDVRLTVGTVTRAATPASPWIWCGRAPRCGKIIASRVE